MPKGVFQKNVATGDWRWVDARWSENWEAQDTGPTEPYALCRGKGGTLLQEKDVVKIEVNPENKQRDELELKSSCESHAKKTTGDS